MRNLKSVMRVISKAARDLAEIATGAVATIIAFMLWNLLGCKVLVASWVVAVVLSVIVLKREKWLLAKRIKAVVIIAIIALVCSIFCLVNNHKKAIEQPIASTEVETQEETVTEEVAVSEEESDVQPKSVEKNTTKRLTEETRKECIDLGATTKGQEHLDITGSKEARGEEITSFVSNETEPVVTDDTEIVEEAKASEDKIVNEMTTTDNKTGEEVTISTISKKEEEKPAESKDESTKIDTSDASDCVSGEEEKEEKEQEISKDNTAEQTVKEEDLSDFSAEDLKDLAEETVVEETTIETVTVETVETVDTEVIVEDVEVEITTPAVEETGKIENEDVKVEEPAVEKTEQQIVVDEEIKVEEKVEEKVIAPVVVTAIDGYTTFVGSQLQFQVSGDDVIIEGLDGINHTFSNGILTIDTGSEATIISVSISNSVNAVDFDITVNGIIG